MKPLPGLLLSLLLVLSATPAPAEEAVTVPVADPQAPRPAETPAPAPTLGESLRAVLDQEAEAMALLRERAAVLRGTEEEIAVQREIQALKLRTEHRLLRLQLEHARRTGDESIVQRLEEGLRALEKLVDPPTPADGADASAPRE